MKSSGHHSWGNLLSCSADSAHSRTASLWSKSKKHCLTADLKESLQLGLYYWYRKYYMKYIHKPFLYLDSKRNHLPTNSTFRFCYFHDFQWWKAYSQIFRTFQDFRWIWNKHFRASGQYFYHNYFYILLLLCVSMDDWHNPDYVCYPRGESQYFVYTVWKQAIHSKKRWENFPATKIALLFMT